MKKLTTLIAAIAALLALASCAEDSEQLADATSTAANGDVYSDADVAFATDMIQHHAQALTMVDMTRERELSPEVRQLADEILAAQGPEIETMTGWLTDWDQPVPETMRDHANSHGEGHMEDSDMPGMMSQQEMAQLEAAQGPEFEEMWLETMIEHHKGAIEMAQREQSDGTFDPAIELAGTIESAQQEEIEHMEDLLSS